MQTISEIWTTERVLFKKVTENTHLIAWATDEEGRRFYLSPAWYAFTGAKSQAGPMLDWLDLIRDDERDEVETAFAYATDKRLAFGMPYWLQRRDGGYTRVWDMGLPKFDDDLQFKGHFGTVCPLDQAESEPILRHKVPILTPREREILRMVADGNTTGTISDILGIAGRTVDQHVENAIQKLGALNRVHAVSKAMRRNDF